MQIYETTNLRQISLIVVTATQWQFDSPRLDPTHAESAIFILFESDCAPLDNILL